MLKFNNNHIFTGYLKQLLASFNLPKYRIYTKEQEKHFNKYNEELNVIPTVRVVGDQYPEDLRYVSYIKDDIIQQYIKEQDTDGSYKYYWQVSNNHYHENKKELNYTKTFQIKNNIYDTYTHEYLGDFLRFFRDYHNVNLMPLYNCFTDKLCTNLKLNFEAFNTNISFDSKNESFKIYMLPVKLFQKYTIAIDSNLPIELCCGFFGAYLDSSDKSKRLSENTYQKINATSFSSPFVYDKLSFNNISATDIDTLDLAQNEDDLKLFVKIPVNNKSSITILEGDYTRFNDSYHNIQTNIIHQNKTIINFSEEVSEDEKYEYEPLLERDFTPISQLQLLMLNTGVSYPFAERLIEYLSENAITSLDRIPDNIKRVQTILGPEYKTRDTKKYSPETYGLWDNKLQLYLYDAMVNNSLLKYKPELKHDLLGFVDKDTEENVTKKVYKTVRNKVTGTIVKNDIKRESISKIDLYKELYNNTYLADSEKYVDMEEN